jgi:hypothetical protein
MRCRRRLWRFECFLDMLRYVTSRRIIALTDGIFHQRRVCRYHGGPDGLRSIRRVRSHRVRSAENQRPSKYTCPLFWYCLLSLTAGLFEDTPGVIKHANRLAADDLFALSTYRPRRFYDRHTVCLSIRFSFLGQQTLSRRIADSQYWTSMNAISVCIYCCEGIE